MSRVGLVSPVCNSTTWLDSMLVKYYGCDIKDNGEIIVADNGGGTVQPVKDPPALPGDGGTGTGGNGSQTPAETGGVMAFVKENPLVVAGAAAAAIYFFTRKKRRK